MNKPPTACSNSACSNPAEKGGLCAECKPKTPASKHDYHREWKHLYQTPRWRNLRFAIFVRDEYLCQVCKRAQATIADHIVDHRGNLVLFWDPKNLQASCKPCHDFKTGSTHGIGKRNEPIRPHVVGGIIQASGPSIQRDIPNRISDFDFLAALRKKPGSGGPSGAPAGQ